MEISRDNQLLQQEPAGQVPSPRGGLHIPIEILENDLDLLQWSTRNYHWQVLKDGYANLVVAASIELIIIVDEKERTFVGCCNFDIKSIAPIPDWNATAKSMCIKNAASEAGKRLGRGLNSEVIPVTDNSVKPSSAKLNPDSKIMKQFLKAVEEKDEATVTMLSNIYELKTE